MRLSLWGISLLLLLTAGCFQAEKPALNNPQATQPGPVIPATLAASSSDAGSVVVGLSASQLVSLANSGVQHATQVTGTLTGAGFSFTGGAFPGTRGNCGSDVASQSNCTVDFTFAPSLTGTATATLTLTYSDGSGNAPVTQSFTVTGTGVTQILTLSDGPTYTYPDTGVGNSADHTFSVTNTSRNPATSVTETTLAAPYAFKGGAFPGTGGTCATTIAAQTSCTVVVSYTPVVTGATSSTLTLQHSNGVSTKTVSDSLAGTAPAAASHLRFSVQPPRKASVSSTFSATVQMIDLNGNPAHYYNGVIQLAPINDSVDFTLGSLSGTTATMSNGAAVFSGLSYGSKGLIKLRPSVVSSSIAIPTVATLNSNTGSGYDSTAVAVDMLAGGSGLLLNSLLAYLPFDANLNALDANGALKQAGIFTPGFSVRVGAVDNSGAGLTSESGLTLGLHDLLQYPMGSAQAAANSYDNFDYNQGTIRFWFKPGWDWRDGFAHVLLDGSSTPIFIAKTADNKLRFVFNYAGSSSDVAQIDTPASNIAQGSYNHLVAIWSLNRATGGHYVNAYLNDVSSNAVYTEAAAASCANCSSSNLITLGTQGASAGSSQLASPRGVASGANFFLQGLRIDSRPWTAAEVAADYAHGDFLPVSADSSTRLALPFATDAAFGDSMAAVRPYASLSATLNGLISGSTVPVSSTAGFAVGDRVAISGAGAIMLDGTSGRLSITDGGSAADVSTVSIVAGLTLEAWVKISSAPASTASLIEKWDGSSSTPYPFSLRVTTAGVLQAARSNATQASSVTGNTVVTDGKWHHVALTYDPSLSASHYTLYVDGASDATATDPLLFADSSTIPFGNTVALTVGATAGGTGYLAGEVDEVRVWNYPRTAAQISSGMPRSLTGPTATGNILTNPGLEVWTNSSTPGGAWQNSGTSPVTITEESIQIRGGAHGALVTFSGSNSYMAEDLIGGLGYTVASLQGRAINIGAWVRTSATDVRLSFVANNIDAGTGAVAAYEAHSSYYTGTGINWQYLSINLPSLSLSQGGTTTYMKVGIRGDTNQDQAYVDDFDARLAGAAVILHLDDQTGTTATDGSGAGSNATLSGGATWRGDGILDSRAGDNSLYSTATISSIGAGNLTLGSAPSALGAGGFVTRTQRADSKPVSLVPFSDFEGTVNAWSQFGTGARFFDQSAKLLDQGSLHVKNDQLGSCSGTASGVSFNAPDTTASDYVLSFDYAAASGSSFTVTLVSDGSCPGGTTLLSGLSSTTPAHVETVYHLPGGATTNRIYFQGALNSEWWMDNVRLFRSQVSGGDFEQAFVAAGAPNSGSFGPGFTATGGATGSSVGGHGGAAAQSVTGASGAGFTQTVTGFTAGSFYLVSFWAKVSSGTLQFTSSTGSARTIPVVNALAADNANAWQRYSAIFRSPDGANETLAWTASGGAATFAVDDISLFELERVLPVTALPVSANANGAVSNDTCNIDSNGKVACGVTTITANLGATLGAGASCPASDDQTAACSNGASQAGGSTDGALLVSAGSSLALNPDTSVMNTSYAISLWYKLLWGNAAATPSTLVSAGLYNALNSLWLFDSVGQDTYDLRGSPSAGMSVTQSSASAQSAAAWVHRVITFDNSSKQYGIYTNGSPDSTGASPDPFSAIPGPLYLGWISGRPSADAYFDNVRVFNRALSHDEILSICEIEKPSGFVCP